MGKKGSGRLSDTAAIVKQGINRPGARVAPFGGNVSYERGADDAVSGPTPGQFRRETSAGAEGLSGAMAELRRK